MIGSLKSHSGATLSSKFHLNNMDLLDLLPNLINRYSKFNSHASFSKDNFTSTKYFWIFNFDHATRTKSENSYILSVAILNITRNIKS